VLIQNTVYSYDRDEQIDVAKVLTSRGCYHHVFNFLHRWKAYGHYLIDYFPIVSMISDYYKQEGYFIVREKCAFVLDAAPLFGVSVDRLLVIAGNEAIFAKNLYMVRPLQMGNPTPLFIYKARGILAQGWGLDGTIPFRFVFCNRASRNVVNLQEWLNHVRIAHPNLTIQVYCDELSGLSKKTALFFNEMLFAMGYHASGLFNAIFQQPNTVSMVLETDRSNGLLFPILARVFGRHCFVYRDRRTPHYSRSRAMNIAGLTPIADLALERAKLIQQHYFRIENPQPWADVVLGWGFRIARTHSVNIDRG
jgi:hypothetical protein